jgi:hypothetical protein
MPESHLRLIKRCAEFKRPDEIVDLKKSRRGVYVLYRKSPGKDAYSVVYVGLARTSMKSRLRKHRLHKSGQWTHFSVFEVWDNIRDDEIEELEGLFRHFYKKDPRASGLNLQRGFKKIKKVRENDLNKWQDSGLDNTDKLPADSTAKRRAKQKPKTAKPSLILAGRVERRIRLQATWHGHKYQAALRKDGQIRFKDRLYNHPSAAARAASKKKRNGWTFWSYRKNGEWISLLSLRR